MSNQFDVVENVLAQYSVQKATYILSEQQSRTTFPTLYAVLRNENVVHTLFPSPSNCLVYRFIENPGSITVNTLTYFQNDYILNDPESLILFRSGTVHQQVPFWAQDMMSRIALLGDSYDKQLPDDVLAGKMLEVFRLSTLPLRGLPPEKAVISSKLMQTRLSSNFITLAGLLRELSEFGDLIVNY